MTDVTPTLTAPVIASAAKEGDVLSITSGAVTNDSDTTLTYQWQHNGTNISGATGATYVVNETDEGAAIQVVGSAACRA